MALAAGEAGSLWHALSLVPDNRRAEGKRYPLASLLLIAVAAFLSGRRAQLGIVRWGRRLTREALASIGISRARVPAPSVWCELFKGLDVSALERVLGNWVRGEQAAGHVAIDGKRLRGSATAQSAGVHLLAAFSASLQGVIGQLAVAPDCNEITGALQLLKTLLLDGVIITGDAIFTQREICRVIIDGGGDYFFTVKACPEACPRLDPEEGGGQSANAEIGHCLGLRAVFLPLRSGRRRLTCGAPKRLKRVVAGSRPDRWKSRPVWPSIWRHPGPVRRKSAVLRASADPRVKPHRR
jgi:DDE_Tnp_1-associated